MTDFDYNAPADLFPSRSKKGHRLVGYRRFDNAAEAIRYAIEVLPPDFFPSTVMEVHNKRLDGLRIRELYDSAGLPPRAKVVSANSGYRIPSQNAQQLVALLVWHPLTTPSNTSSSSDDCLPGTPTAASCCTRQSDFKSTAI